jgi:two-component system chemotaxis response regulator CheY
MTRKALVVDDSMLIRRMAGAFLREQGFEVLEAVNGRDALRVLGDAPVQLILTDINMPEMDGLDFIQAVRSNKTHKFTPLLVLTTETKTSLMDRAKELGITGWVVKPFKPEKVVEAIRRVVA